MTHADWVGMLVMACGFVALGLSGCELYPPHGDEPITGMHRRVMRVLLVVFGLIFGAAYFVAER